jgi:hypothetical protein
MEYLSGAPLYGRHLASPTNITQGKGQPGTNTLRFTRTVVNYSCKEFYNIGSRSSLYAMSLIVLCIVFTATEVISDKVKK